MEITPEMKERANAIVQQMTPRVRVTKVVATRYFKTSSGDIFVGFSSEFDSVQEDGGQDLVKVADDPSDSGLSMSESRKASLVLGWQVDKAAAERALASGSWSLETFQTNLKKINDNYTLLLGMKRGE